MPIGEDIYDQLHPSQSTDYASEDSRRSKYAKEFKHKKKSRKLAKASRRRNRRK